MEKKTWRRAHMRLTIVWVGLLVALYLLYYYLGPAMVAILGFLVPLVTPFLIAVVLAALIDPLVNRMQERLHWPRGTTVLAVIVVFLGGAVTLLTLLTLRLVGEAVRFSQQAPGYYAGASAYLQELFTQAQHFYATFNLPPQILAEVQSGLDSFLKTAADWAGQVINWVLGVVTAVPGAFLWIIFTLLASYFFSRDKALIQDSLLGLFAPTTRSRLERVGQDLGAALVGFLRAQAMLISLTILESLVGLLILRVDYAVLVSILVGIADLLPVLGPGTIFVPWALAVFLQGQTGLAVALLVLYAIIMVVRQVLQPRVVAKHVGLHPLEALVAIYAGMKALGVWGLILGPILWVVGKASWRAGLFNGGGEGDKH